MADDISCPACKTELFEDSIFCYNCGLNLELADKPQIEEIQPTNLTKIETLLPQYIKLQKAIDDLLDVENIYNTQLGHFQEIERHQDNLHYQITQAKRTTRREKTDVEQMEKLTWVSLKARIKGDRDQLLSQEEQEYFAAKERYETLIAAREDNQVQVDTAKRQLNDAKTVLDHKIQLKEELDKIISIIGAEIKDSKEEALEKEVKSLENQHYELGRELFLLKQNQSYAKNAVSGFRKALAKLGKAKDYSTWDTYFGGGAMVDSWKRSNLREAQSHASRANDSLRRAAKAYSNDRQTSYAHVKDTGWWSDTFFDSWFTDLDARSKIDSSIRSVQNALHEANRLVSLFGEEMAKIQDQVNTLAVDKASSASKLRKERIRLIEEFITQKNK